MTWFHSLHPYARGLIEIAALWAAGWLIYKLTVPLLRRLAKFTPIDWDDLVIDALAPYIPVWFALAGIPIAARHALLPEAWIATADRSAMFLLYLTLSLALASVVARFVAYRAGPITSKLPATTLTQNAIRIGIVMLGAVAGLGSIGIAVAPMLTALGVGSLAVALALQPTLTNLIAGFLITFAKQVRLGDVIELEQGQLGVVEDISWRTLTIREPAGNLITIPNARMAELIVRNFALPSPDCVVIIPVGVAYGSDLARVERVLIESARVVRNAQPIAVQEFEPLVRVMSFADSSVNLIVIMRAVGALERIALQSAALMAIHARFAAEGIEIPFPQRVVHMQAEPAGRPANGG